MGNNLPTDPVMLLSYVNTQLRDHYASLEEFCGLAGISPEEITEALETIDYSYDAVLNQFK